MKQRSVKTKILRLIKHYGNRDKVAEKLMVTPRYIYYFEKNERVPGRRLYRDICQLYEEMLVLK